MRKIICPFGFPKYGLNFDKRTQAEHKQKYTMLQVSGAPPNKLKGNYK
jgi:hypothetical protein